MNPGPFFTWRELTRTSTGLPNEPTGVHRRELQRLHDLVLHPLRLHLGRPVFITSGYRTADVNRAVNGSPTSAHMTGRAADVRVEGMRSAELAIVVLDLKLPCRELVWYGPPDRHVHVEVVAAPEVLKKVPGGYLEARPVV